MTSEYDELLARLEALVSPSTPDDSISTATAVETIDGAAAAIRALTAQVMERDAVIEQLPHTAACHSRVTDGKGGWVVNEARCTCAKSQAPHDALRQERENVWDECLNTIEENQLNTSQAREGNPYRIVGI